MKKGKRSGNKRGNILRQGIMANKVDEEYVNIAFLCAGEKCLLRKVEGNIPTPGVFLSG
jgi:hypothetical protein